MALHRNNQGAKARRIFAKARRLAIPRVRAALTFAWFQAEAKFPSSPDVLNYYGELLLEASELALAESKFEAALKVSGNRFALAYVNLGVLRLHVR